MARTLKSDKVLFSVTLLLLGLAAGTIIESSLGSDAAGRAKFCDLVEEADRIQFADRRFRRELAAWVHSNRSRLRGDCAPASATGLNGTKK